MNRRKKKHMERQLNCKSQINTHADRKITVSKRRLIEKSTMKSEEKK